MHGYKRSESGKKRAEVGSTRWVYNTFLRRQTKVRWHCGLCDVWCKDENGFKCHLEYDTHIKRSQLARQSQSRKKYAVEPQDREFALRFVNFLGHHHLDRKVSAYDVYTELFPRDRWLRTMQDTCWGTLGRFVCAMSDSGEFEAQRDANGWVVRIGRELLEGATDEARAAAAEGGDAAELGYLAQSILASRDFYAESDDEAPAAREQGGIGGEGPQPVEERPRPTAVVRNRTAWSKWTAAQAQGSAAPDAATKGEDGGAHRAAQLAAAAGIAPPEEKAQTGTKREPDGPAVQFQLRSTKAARLASAGGSGSSGGLASKLLQGPACATAPAVPALSQGLVVKVLCPVALQGRACKKKAVTCSGDHSAPPGMVWVRLLPGSCSGAPEQEKLPFLVARPHLETVLPCLGGHVRVLSDDCPGAQGLGREGTLQSLELDTFSCTVRLDSGATLPGLPYEVVCKVWAPAHRSEDAVPSRSDWLPS